MSLAAARSGVPPAARPVLPPLLQPGWVRITHWLNVAGGARAGDQRLAHIQRIADLRLQIPHAT